MELNASADSVEDESEVPQEVGGVAGGNGTEEPDIEGIAVLLLNQPGQGKDKLIDIPNSANVSGYSVRHFRRILEEEGIAIHKIGRKFFVRRSDILIWQENYKAKTSRGNYRKKYGKILRRPAPPSIDELLGSHRKELRELQAAVGEVFAVDLQFRGSQSADKDMTQPVSVWVFLLMNVLAIRSKDAAIIADCRIKEVNRFCRTVERELSVNHELAAIVEKIRMIMDEEISRQRPVSRHISPFEYQLPEDFEARGYTHSAIEERIMKILIRIMRSNGFVSRTATPLIDDDDDIREVLETTEPAELQEEEAMPPPAPLSEKEQLRQILTRANSVKEAAAKLGLKLPQLIVKCQKFDLVGDLSRLLG